MTYQIRGENFFRTGDLAIAPAMGRGESAPAASITQGLRPAPAENASAGALLDSHQVASFVTDTQSSATTDGTTTDGTTTDGTTTDGTTIIRGSSSDASGDGVDQMHYSGYGWHVVPSAQNQYGEGIGDAAAKVDVAGDFVTDWFVV